MVGGAACSAPPSSIATIPLSTSFLLSPLVSPYPAAAGSSGRTVPLVGFAVLSRTRPVSRRLSHAQQTIRSLSGFLSFSVHSSLVSQSRHGAAMEDEGEAHTRAVSAAAAERMTMTMTDDRSRSMRADPAAMPSRFAGLDAPSNHDAVVQRTLCSWMHASLSANRASAARERFGCAAPPNQPFAWPHSSQRRQRLSFAMRSRPLPPEADRTGPLPLLSIQSSHRRFAHTPPAEPLSVQSALPFLTANRPQPTPTRFLSSALHHATPPRSRLCDAPSLPLHVD